MSDRNDPMPQRMRFVRGIRNWSGFGLPIRLYILQNWWTPLLAPSPTVPATLCQPSLLLLSPSSSSIALRLAALDLDSRYCFPPDQDFGMGGVLGPQQAPDCAYHRNFSPQAHALEPLRAPVLELQYFVRHRRADGLRCLGQSVLAIPRWKARTKSAALGSYSHPE